MSFSGPRIPPRTPRATWSLCLLRLWQVFSDRPCFWWPWQRWDVPVGYFVIFVPREGFFMMRLGLRDLGRQSTEMKCPRQHLLAIGDTYHPGWWPRPPGWGMLSVRPLPKLIPKWVFVPRSIPSSSKESHAAWATLNEAESGTAAQTAENLQKPFGIGHQHNEFLVMPWWDL